MHPAAHCGRQHIAALIDDGPGNVAHTRPSVAVAWMTTRRAEIPASDPVRRLGSAAVVAGAATVVAGTAAVTGAVVVAGAVVTAVVTDVSDADSARRCVVGSGLILSIGRQDQDEPGNENGRRQPDEDEARPPPGVGRIVGRRRAPWARGMPAVGSPDGGANAVGGRFRPVRHMSRS